MIDTRYGSAGAAAFGKIAMHIAILTMKKRMHYMIPSVIIPNFIGQNELPFSQKGLSIEIVLEINIVVICYC